MSPRKYDMGKRAAAVEATRSRIVEATMELHGERGIHATSWDDIARRAGVAVGTVYRHFPSLEELLPACGELSLERLAPPDPEWVDDLFRGVRSRRARIERLVETTFDMYERAPDVMRSIRRDRETLALLAEAHEDIEDRLDTLARAALAPFDTDVARLRVVRALTDFDAWRALRERGVPAAESQAVVVESVLGWLERS
jgi:AcrR family transcriptional regulator